MTDLGRWPAVVLAAGLATRLRPLSDRRAKAALPLAGLPLICRILTRLARAGVRRVVINLHHHAETITALVGDGSPFGLDVRYSWEREPLGSAGGPARALPLVAADRFFIVNGDTLAEADLEQLADAHVGSGALVTLSVVPGDPRYHAVLADAEGVVRDFSRASQAPRVPLASSAPQAPVTLQALLSFHFVGLQAVNASAFAGVNPDLPSDAVGGVYAPLVRRKPGSVRVFGASTFLDIGTPRDYLDTAIRLARDEGRPLDCGRDVVVRPSAHLQDTILWDRVTVEDNVSLARCVVADDVRVPAGSRYAECSLVQTERGMMAVPFDPAHP